METQIKKFMLISTDLGKEAQPLRRYPGDSNQKDRFFFWESVLFPK